MEVGYCSAPFRLCPQPPGRGLQNAVSSPFSPVTSWEAVAVVTTSMQGKHPQPLGGGGVWGDREPRGPGVLVCPRLTPPHPAHCVAVPLYWGSLQQEPAQVHAGGKRWLIFLRPLLLLSKLNK